MSASVPYAAQERARQIIQGTDKEFVFKANNIEPRYFSITVDWGPEETWGMDNKNMQAASALANMIWDFISDHPEFIENLSFSFGSGSHNFTLPEEMLAAMRQEMRGRGRSEGQASA